LGAKINPATRCTGRGDKERREREEKREYLLAKSIDNNCMLYLNII
jgi:hypothetical protein